MQVIRPVTAWVLLAALLVTTSNLGCKRRKSDPRRGEGRAGVTALADPAVHPTFNPALDELRSTFIEYENRAREGRGEPSYDVREVDVPVEGHEALKLSIVFLPPLEEAKRLGYAFGKAPGRTDADRRAVMGLALKRVDEVRFAVTLHDVAALSEDENAVLPTISFKLVNEDGVELDPIEPPEFGIPPPRDLLASGERDLLFPLYKPGTSVPLFRRGTRTIKLVVNIGGVRRMEEFNL